MRCSTIRRPQRWLFSKAPSSPAAKKFYLPTPSRPAGSWLKKDAIQIQSHSLPAVTTHNNHSQSSSSSY